MYLNFPRVVEGTSFLLFPLFLFPSCSFQSTRACTYGTIGHAQWLFSSREKPCLDFPLGFYLISATWHPLWKKRLATFLRFILLAVVRFSSSLRKNFLFFSFAFSGPLPLPFPPPFFAPSPRYSGSSALFFRPGQTNSLSVENFLWTRTFPLPSSLILPPTPEPLDPNQCRSLRPKCAVS